MAPRLLALAVFAAVGLVPIAGDAYLTGQFARYVVYGLLAVSLSLVWGRGGILCFGQAMFFGIGGYVMAALTKGMGPGWLSSTYAALTFAIAAPAAFAALLGFFLFRGRGLAGAYLAIVTLAIALVLERLMSNWYGMGVYNGLLDIPPLDFGLFGAHLEIWDETAQLYIALGFAAAVYFGLDRLMGAPFGVLVTAVRTNPRRAEFFGYDVLWVKLAVFVIGAGVAGLAGALFVSYDGFASPTLIGFGLSTEVLIWVALGGKEMLLAAFVGAIVVRLMESYFSEFLGGYWILALGLVFMASVVLLPRGLIATPIAALAARLRRAGGG